MESVSRFIKDMESQLVSKSILKDAALAHVVDRKFPSRINDNRIFKVFFIDIYLSMCYDKNIQFIVYIILVLKANII